jgi:glycosyltransferase involved in cell wall biosynthesis
VSFFDPDGLIAGKGLGISVDSQGDFEEALARLLQNDDERQQIGHRSRQFVIDRYSPRAIAAEYARLIAENFGISLADG